MEDGQERDFAMEHSDANRLSDKFNSLASDHLILRNTVVGIETSVKDQGVKLDKIADAITTSGRPNMTVMGLVLTAFGMAGTAAWFVIGLNAQIAMKPIESGLASLTSVVATHERFQEKFISQFETLQRQTFEEKSETAKERSELREKIAIAEAEAQEQDKVRNLENAQQERINALLWNHSHPGNPYPIVSGYFPEVAHSSR